MGERQQRRSTTPEPIHTIPEEPTQEESIPEEPIPEEPTQEESIPEDAEDWVLAHNIYRCMHNAQPVEWSQEMYQDAKDWFHDKTAMAHSDSYYLPIPAGENLAWKSPTAFDAFGATKVW